MDRTPRAFHGTSSALSVAPDWGLHGAAHCAHCRTDRRTPSRRIAARIDGSDRTKLINGLERQVTAVRAALAAIAPDVPVHGCLCFVAPRGILAASGLPLARTLTIRGYPLLDPRRLAKRLKSHGRVGPDQAAVLCAELSQRFPPA
jgi:hypothetical protein